MINLSKNLIDNFVNKVRGRSFYQAANRTRSAGSAVARIFATRRRPSVKNDRMRKLTLADCFIATLAIGIVIGFPIWHWISKML